jgi:diadenosine tetraphosphate (Ap4A) HIT family hydrolase
MGHVLTVPKRLTHGEELVVLRKDEYERLLRQTEEMCDALKIIAEGEQAYREGRTIKASSLKEALRLYGKRAH